MHLLKCVAFKVPQVLFGHHSSKLTFLSALHNNLIDPLLKISSINFFVVAILPSLNSLSLHKHCLTFLLV